MAFLDPSLAAGVSATVEEEGAIGFPPVFVLLSLSELLLSTSTCFPLSSELFDSLGVSSASSILDSSLASAAERLWPLLFLGVLEGEITEHGFVTSTLPLFAGALVADEGALLSGPGVLSAVSANDISGDFDSSVRSVRFSRYRWIRWGILL